MATQTHPELNIHNPQLYLFAYRNRCLTNGIYTDHRPKSSLPPPPSEVVLGPQHFKATPQPTNLYEAAVNELAAEASH